MELVTDELRQELLNNWNSEDPDPKPVLKIFSPIGASTWIIASMDDHDTMYGLCDLGTGKPELGHVSLIQLQKIRIPFMAGTEMELERDIYFKPQHSLNVYAKAARMNGSITENTKLLDAASVR